MKLGKKILIGFICCIAVLIVVAVFSFINSQKYIASNEWVDHTNQVLFESGQLLNSSLEAETATRGFVITGDNTYLLPLADAKTDAFQHLEKIIALSSDNPVQQKNTKDLEKTLTFRFETLRKCADLRKINFEKAQDFVFSGQGRTIQSEISRIIQRIQQIEKNLLTERRQTSINEAGKSKIIFLGLFSFIVIVLVIVYRIIISNLKQIKKSDDETLKRNWLLAGNAGLNKKLNGIRSIEQLMTNTISYLCTYLNSQIGAVYVVNESDLSLELGGQYAGATPENTKRHFARNEGLIGQVAEEQKQILVSDINAEHNHVLSSVINEKPRHLLIAPFMFEGKTLGVAEIGTLTSFSVAEEEFINNSMDTIAIYVNSTKATLRVHDLLVEAQVQTEELQAQQEELRQMNEELEEQTQNLKQQQEELQQTNEELEEQTQSLEMKNTEVEAAKSDIEQKTKQLEVSSRYKSEFLANMSHELRTPLNSLLILSKDLSENKKKNLDAIQIESAEIIYKSGQDLLVLINEVLDLSKIEAGMMSVNTEELSLKNFAEDLLRGFNSLAQQKGLKLMTSFDEGLPEKILTDSQRLNQILKNLISNALKFTENGSVTIRFGRNSETTVMISVTDTGIGIPENKQMAIFEAFQQADGGTSRKYGGTGLGLSISRELAKLLGGEITVSSRLNEGSTFSLIIPIEIYPIKPSEFNDILTPENNYQVANNGYYLNYPSIADDRNSIIFNDKIVLIIEDDLNFAAILSAQAKQKGFKCLSAATGEDGLHLAFVYKPQAIILDMDLPGIKGNIVLKELKSNPSLKNIPVHIMSGNDRLTDQVSSEAVSYLVKPINRNELDEAFRRIENLADKKIKNLLIIEDDPDARRSIRKLAGNPDVNCIEAATGEEALSLYITNPIDCIILDLGLPDMSGVELIHKMKDIKDKIIPPLLIYTGKEITKGENDELLKYAESIIIKGTRSEERLLDETALFLYKTSSNLPELANQPDINIYNKDVVFFGKKVLLADDDARNIFALSIVLKERGIVILTAENGKFALDMLKTNPDIDLVLMDVMMPEMDGYETMREIRSQTIFRNLPMIALTAKAMKDDKQKCIDAGANDYITKPIDIDRLLSLMRVWLSK